MVFPLITCTTRRRRNCIFTARGKGAKSTRSAHAAKSALPCGEKNFRTKTVDHGATAASLRQDARKSVYRDLLELVRSTDYFVLTTNVERCFQKSGFNKERLFYTQGDYGLWQRAVPYHEKTYDNEEAVRKMIADQKERRIPSDLIPRCIVCDKPMSINLCADNAFVEDDDCRKAAKRYQAFLRFHSKSKTASRSICIDADIG